MWGGNFAGAERQFRMADRTVDYQEVLPAKDEVMPTVPTNLLLPGRRLSGIGGLLYGVGGYK